jgi:hypothetical protein
MVIPFSFLGGLHDSKPFDVSVYCGTSKRSNLQGFLGDFIREYNELRRNGLQCDGQNYGIKMHCLICDAQARSFLKCIICPTGFSCCERCVARGEKFEFRLIIVPIDAQLRDDQSFRLQTDTGHHWAVTPFILLSGLDLIADFVLDPIHLIFLAVVKTLIVSIWMGPLPHCWSANEKKRVSEMILYVRQFYIYYSFTEFLSFLLYSG